MARQHAQRLQALPAVTIAGVAARRPEAAAAVAPGARVVADVDALLRDVGIDVLYACVPPGAHGGEIEAAAAAGVHCFLEKPVARSRERIDSIAQAIG
ncbi:MAG: Gfo/Idh/MocA family oxidoreductase, partial [Planctomycetota bacterium]